MTAASIVTMPALAPTCIAEGIWWKLMESLPDRYRVVRNGFLAANAIALALTVAVTMLAICLWSTTVGSLVPIVAERFGVDPAVLSARIMSDVGQAAARASEPRESAVAPRPENVASYRRIVPDYIAWQDAMDAR